MLSNFRKSFLGIAFGATLALAAGFAPQTAQAGAASTYLVNKMVNEVVNGVNYTPPTTLYVALATTTGSVAACGTEVTGGSYARVAVTANSTNWTTSTAGSTANATVITFPTPTASWSTVVEFCVFDASTSGNLLFRAPLSSSVSIASGASPPTFAVGALTWTVN